MPTLGLSIAFGLVGGFAGALVMAVLMMLMLGKRIKDAPPSIMAEKMFGDSEKRPMVLFPVMAIWGIIYGIVVSLAGFTSYIVTGLWFMLIPWTMMNIVMLPMAGAGLFGSKRWNMIWMLSLVMHVIWGVIVGLVFSFLTGIVG